MIVDSDIAVDLLRHHPSAVWWLSGQSRKPSITGVGVLELLFGAQSRADLTRIQGFLTAFDSVWPEPADFLAATTYARLHLSDGTGILDALVAAVAIRTNEPLATFNVKHFRNIPGLVTVQPYSR